MISTEELYSIYLDHPVIATDTRKISEGALFFCLRGEKFDGNTFAKAALDLGARHVVVDDPAYAALPGALLVSNVLESLQQLARYHRQQLKIPFIGITGTNGKTTTKELVAAVLASKYRVCATQGNLNNHIGVPLTLLSVTPQTEIAVIEMGANHPGEIEELCQICLPDAGLITNIGKAHLEGFGDLDTIVETKTALYRSVMKNDGPLFVNSADPILTEKSNGSQRYFYGRNQADWVHGKFLQTDPFLSLRWENGQVDIHTQLAGSWNFDNLMAAVCVGKFYGIDPDNVKNALELYHPTNMRSQLTRTEKNTLLLDTYNANPTSMQVAITHFAGTSQSNKVLILGDMLELGDASAKEHESMLELIHALGFQEVWLVGPCFSGTATFPEYRRFTSTGEALAFCTTHPLVGKSILIKGSRGIGLEGLLACL